VRSGAAPVLGGQPGHLLPRLDLEHLERLDDVLISDDDGTPSSDFGQIFQTHLLGLFPSLSP
jgi:hypothetical protein